MGPIGWFLALTLEKIRSRWHALWALATIGRYGGTQLFTTSQTAGAQCVELRLKPQLEAAR